jgi:hypothetical protein
MLLLSYLRMFNGINFLESSWQRECKTQSNSQIRRKDISFIIDSKKTELSRYLLNPKLDDCTREREETPAQSYGECWLTVSLELSKCIKVLLKAKGSVN